MRDAHVCYDGDRAADDGSTFSGFALRVLDVLVDRSRRTTSTLRRDLVVTLADAMVTQDAWRIEKTLGDFRRACISPGAMADVYIPAAALYLGKGWEQDRLSFAEVTIATARLQALVRAIGTRWGGDAAHVPGRKAILMMVPAGEQHTLGAVIAAGQLRRRGLSVCLRLGPSQSEVIGLLRARRFDAAMVSVSLGTDVGKIGALVGTVRSFGRGGLPIVVGGAGAGEVLCDGADLWTQDLRAALDHCGFLPPAKIAEPRGGDLARAL